MRFLRICFGWTIACAMVLAADPVLLQLVPSDAAGVAGLQVSRGKRSPLGQYLLAQIRQQPATAVSRLSAAAGFDPQRDISELVFAFFATPAAAPIRELLLARGSFNPARMNSAASARGSAIERFDGIDLLSGGPLGKRALAFLDSGTALLGDAVSVKEAIEKHTRGDPAASWTTRARELSADDDFWFLTTGPVSGLLSLLRGGDLGPAMQNGRMFQSVTEASGGAKLGETVVFTASAVMRSPADAQSLTGVLHFMASMIESNQTANPETESLALLLASLVLSTDANVIHLSLAVPETQVESFLAVARQPHLPPAPKQP